MRLLYVLDRFPLVSETFVTRELRELRRGGDALAVYVRARGDAPPRHAGAAAVLPAVHVRPGRAVRARAVARTALAAPRATFRALAWALVQRRYERGLLEAFADACVLRPAAARADRIHAHFAHWPASVAVLASLLSGTPCSFTTHARDLYTADPRALRRKVAAARRAIAVSEHTRAVLAEAAGPQPAGRIAVVRNGVEPVTAPRRTDDPPLVLAVARLVEKKGLDTLVDAAARSTAGARWLVLGDGPLRGALEARARGRVTFAGAVCDTVVADALARASVFALPCRVAADGDRDGLPVALVEALAAGVPAVTTPIAGIPEVVQDGVSGLLVAPDDPGALASAVDRVLADPALAARLGAGGRAAAGPYELGACVAALRAQLYAA